MTPDDEEGLLRKGERKGRSMVIMETLRDAAIENICRCGC